MKSVIGPFAGLFASLTLSVLVMAAGLTDLRLVQAVKKGDNKTVRELLQNRADVNSAQPDGSTPLILAANSNNLEVAALLIQAGANVNARNEYGATALSAASTSDHTAMVQLLLNAKADPNLALLSGETPLMTAVDRGNAEAVRALLEHGADADAKETKGNQTALMWAAANKRPEIVKLLLDHEADTRARSKGGFTALFFAAQQGDAVSGRALLEAGADPNAIRQTDGLTPLIMAAESSNNEIAFVLLEKGANPNVMSAPGYTALHYASGCVPDTSVSCRVELADQKRLQLVKSLLAHGANPNARISPRVAPRGYDGVSLKGATPIFFAAASGHVEVVRELMAAGADPFALTDGKISPLHLAAGVGAPNGRDWNIEEQKKLFETTKFLVELGADVNAVGEHKWTALHGAAYKGIDSVVQFLVEHGAKMEVFDEYGQTPLSIASSIITVGGKYAYGNSPREFHRTTRDLLLKLGAKPLAESGVQILGTNSF